MIFVDGMGIEMQDARCKLGSDDRTMGSLLTMDYLHSTFTLRRRHQRLPRERLETFSQRCYVVSSPHFTEPPSFVDNNTLSTRTSHLSSRPLIHIRKKASHHHGQHRREGPFLPQVLVSAPSAWEPVSTVALRRRCSRIERMIVFSHVLMM